MQLHEDCSSRFAAIRAKQEILREMEGAVSEGVVELEKVTFAHTCRTIFQGRPRIVGD